MRNEAFAAIDALNAKYKIKENMLTVKFADNKRQQIKRKLLREAVYEVSKVTLLVYG